MSALPFSADGQLRRRRTESYNRQSDDDIGDVEPLGKGRSTVRKPVGPQQDEKEASDKEKDIHNQSTKKVSRRKDNASREKRKAKTRFFKLLLPRCSLTYPKIRKRHGLWQVKTRGSLQILPSVIFLADGTSGEQARRIRPAGFYPQ